MKLIPLNKFTVWVSPLVYLCGAALCLLLPLQWFIAFIVSVAVHELGHILMFRLLKIPVNEIRVYPMGVRILSARLTPQEEALCAAAGPIIGLLLVFTSKHFPIVAICSGFHSLFNLLPMRSSDGARILRYLVSNILPEKLSGKISGGVECLVTGAIVLVAVYASVFLRMGLLPVVLGFMALRNPFVRK